MASPIADLSYRNYDGPLAPPANRWWAIAKLSIQLAMKKKLFWICTALIGFPYLMQIIVFYVMDTILAQNVALGQKNPLLMQIVWKDRFLDAFSYGQLFYLMVALIVGSGAIANDNRANALLVYLSKPCSKLDYVFGKWLGSFLLFTGITLVPTLIFYGYCFMGYRDYGFYTEDPKLILKLLGLCLVPGFVHSSISLGVSALFNQGRLAGAAYAGLYFIPLFVTKAMQGIINMSGANEAPAAVYRLFYASIDGLQIGLAKVILGTDGSLLFNTRAAGPNGIAARIPTPPPAPSGMILVITGVVCVVAMVLAWWRIRAVEVVG